MDKTYDPKAIEKTWYRRWMEQGLFHGDTKRGGTPYCIMIPPPNVTGILHMGHALNNTLQDILVRWRRMQGRNVVWMPGTDHAGIATQNVVEKALRKEGKTRDQLGRDAFVERVWAWKEEYGSTIIRQLKRLGSSCDWERERFTMDAGLSEAVSEVFVRLYNEGLIYRANYIINWCPRCQTALSDEESEHVDMRGKLYYLRYPLTSSGEDKVAGPDYVVVATTRPETLLGDVAVAIHPDDTRYQALPDRKVILPVLGRELRVIRDTFVSPEFGTGVVKVTPAHDPNDFEMGRRHGLTPINVMNGDGTMNEAAGPYQGMDRFACRKKLLADLEASGLIEKIEDHQNAVGHCYRCDTMVEPRLSPQWFVKMKPLAEPAIAAVKDGRVRFVPDRWTKVYLEWLENIRDWCISRQIWWGHRIPVFTCDRCKHEWAAKGRPTACPDCRAAEFRQDEDVLDTWFSSWLWPFSTLGWPEKKDELAFYYPTHDLVTGSEIIFFWVARMVMAGLKFMGDVPFRQVYIHGTVRDDKGRKMSKSLGNSIDPLTVIDEFSADALRFSLMMITATGQDLFVNNEKFEIGRNFGTKIWNAARFMQMHSESTPAVIGGGGIEDLDPALLSADDKHLLARLQDAISGCTDNLERCRFNDVAHVLYEFVWHQYCDWYVEYAKESLYGDDEARKIQTLKVMHYVFSTALRLLHPLMPFLTEELWHAMGYGAESESIMVAPWPVALAPDVLCALGVEPDGVRYVDLKHDLIRVGRTLRSDYNVAPSVKVRYLIKPRDADALKRLESDRSSIQSLLRAESLVMDVALTPSEVMASGLADLGAVFMPLEGLIDVRAEIERNSAQLAKVQSDLARVEAKLGNASFVDKAPQDVVHQQKARQQEFREKVEKLKRLLDTLTRQQNKP